MVLVLRKFKITIITIQDTPKMKLSLMEKRKKKFKVKPYLNQLQIATKHIRAPYIKILIKITK
jgi:hypothetical protein